MTFLSPIFVFVFLPLAISVYAMLPKLRRVDLLPMISAVFFVCVNIHDFLSLVYYFSVAVCSAVALKLYKKTKRRRFLVSLEALAFLGAIIALIYRFVRGGEAVYHAGLLMCLIAVISMCSDILKNEGRAPDTVWEAMIYVTFFPIMLAGPFVRYGDFIEKLDKISFSTDNFLIGMIRFMIGFIKCVVISAVLGKVYDDVMLHEGQFGLLILLIVAAVCGIRIYTFFSGYSDMARGIALMIGIDIKKDFNDPLLNVAPSDYARGFFRSLSEFAKLYIVTPIDKLFGEGKRGKAVACALAGCYYVFIVCPTPALALILFLPSSILAYFIMFRPKEKRMAMPLALKVISGIFTFVSMSLIWLIVAVGDVFELSELVASVVKNGFGYASHEVMSIVSKAEYIIIPVVAAGLLFAISRIMMIEQIGDDGEISVRTLVLRAACMTVLAVMFVLSVILFLPRFPHVVSYADVFHFV